MIEIDGSYLEGGGQIVRTAIALSAITNKPVRIFNIRKGREKSGLKPQHLQAIKAAGEICDATLTGAEINSQEVSFIPKRIKFGEFLIDTKTAGSITLICQTLFPIALSSPEKVNLQIKGGTAVPFSPTIEYFQNIFGYYLKLMGIKSSVKIQRHGFYPAGGGEVLVEIAPGPLKNIELLNCGKMEKIEVTSVASKHLKTARVAERMVDGFKTILPNISARIEYADAVSPGCFIHSQAIFSLQDTAGENCRLGAGALGARGKKAEEVGKEAARELKKAIDFDAPIDSWMVDQLIPYIALAATRTNAIAKIKIPQLTRHAETNIWVTKKFFSVEFEIKDNIMICSKVD